MRKKKPYGRRRPISKRYARKLVSSANEKKSWDTAIAPTIGTAATITDLTLITQGDDDDSRDGDQLMLKSLQFRMQLTGVVVDAAAGLPVIGTLSSRVRHIIIQWFPPTTPTLANVLDTGTIAALQAPYEHSSSQKMRVLHDRVILVQNLSASSTAYSSFTTRLHHYTRKLVTKIPRRLLQYDTGATSGTSHIYSLLFSDNNTQSPAANIGYRVNFTDI